MVRLRVLFGAMLGTGLIGLGLGIELGQRSRSEEQTAAASPPPVCSVESPVILGYCTPTNFHRGKTIRVARFKVEYARPQIAGDIGSELTEAIVKAIEQKTPYKVEAASDADMELRGTIKTFHIQAPPGYQNAGSDIREMETHLVVELTWKDLRTGESLLPRKDGSSTATTELRSVAYYRPEICEPIEQPRKENVERLADAIIVLMEQSQ